MTQRRTLINDNPKEDKGYNKSHKQTNGGEQAYSRGERPISYWNKKTLLQGVYDTFKYMETNFKYVNRYKGFLASLNYSLDEIMEQLSEHTFEELKSYFLEIRGNHYTGNFYRYTKFYGIVNPLTLLRRIEDKRVITRKRYEQLKLQLEIL